MAVEHANRGRRTTYGEIFVEPEFRVVLASNLLMLLAETLRILALSVLVFAATDSALLSAVTFGAGFLPQAIGGSCLTALADRLPPRGLLVAYDVMQTTVTVFLAAASPPIWAILVLIAVAGSLSPLRAGVTGGLLPEILAGDRYVLGRSMIQTVSSGMQIAGYATGGAMVASLGPRAGLFAAACGYLMSAIVWQWGLHSRRPRVPELSLRATMAATWRTNGRLLRADPRVRSLLFSLWLPIACVTGAEATLVAYAAQAGLPSGSAGYLLAALPIGMVLGDMVVARSCRPHTRARLALPLALLAAMPLLGFAALPGVGLAVALLGLAGSGIAYALPLQAAFVEALPVDVRGRGFGLLSSGLMTAQGLGTVAIGALASALSAALAIVAAGVIMTVSVMMLRRSLSPSRLALQAGA